ncbi:hypothetical protein JQX13_35605 [Archangium violaceum]|uniref:hypothetical protein n=1 Tax=Archangium violaceum TaxID=83451 RepID=UPI00193BCB70|nr:hypothetical protein [Archangium violaceum]QRK05463.1 hypothetical protein JQX13_35605 [Archangium violaceum]
MNRHEVLYPVRGRLLAGCALLMISVAVVLLARSPYPEQLLHLGTLFEGLIGAAVTLAIAAMFPRSPGGTLVLGGASVVLSALVLSVFASWAREYRNLHLVHAVASEACRGMPRAHTQNDEALRRALSLAGLSPGAGSGLLLVCGEDGVETSTTDGFDTGFTLRADDVR